MNKVPVDKKTYIKIVRFTLGAMMDQAQTDKTYNLLADMIDYYLTKIQPDGMLTKDEFTQLCKEVEIERRM